jgi:hypothetical protein
MEFEYPKPAVPVLHHLPLARSRYGLPDDYLKAHQLFADGEADYANGKHVDAAKKFMQVAQLVKAPAKKTTYSDQFAKMRVAAYKDAALAFDVGGKGAEGKKALEGAAKTDADNATLLKSLAKSL